ncbi:MAG: SDR family oxidoreductase [Bacteroidia bacterium]
MLVKYALEQGHEVTAFARNPEDYPQKHKRLTFFRGDVLYPALIEAALPGHDIVVCVIGIRQFSGPIRLLSDGIGNIIQVMKKTGTRRIVTITGAGILQENEHQLIMESLSFPPNLQNLSLDHKRVFEALQASGLEWTIVCPAFMNTGRRTGRYVVRQDYYPSPAQNQCSVSDVADFIVKEMVQNQHLGRRVGIAHPL